MKKYFIFILMMLVFVLVGCKGNNGNNIGPYNNKSFYEANRVELTSTKIIGSKFSNLEIDPTYKDAYINFAFMSASKLLEERNGMFSPISYYFAISQLAELTANETQNEILNALNINDIELLRSGNYDLYRKLVYRNRNSRLEISNSIWLSNNYSYKKDSLETLANKYHSSSYGVDFTSEKDKEAIGEWVYDNTGKKLGKGDFKDLNPDTIFLLLNTIFFEDEWEKHFKKENNFNAPFLGVKGDVEYMRNSLSGTYIKTEDYELSSLGFKNGMRVSFLLPNGSVSEVLNNKELLKKALLTNGLGHYEVNYMIPKFSYKTSFNLIDFTKSIGIKRIFDNSDFSNLTDIGMYVDQVFQKTFIEIDEKGGRATAFTGVGGVKESSPGESVDFKLDKPFIYAIFSGDYPVFIGVVTNPSDNGEFKY